MKNTLCIKCDGRGFHWIMGGIKAHAVAGQKPVILADTYKPGPLCGACKGTGQYTGWKGEAFGCFVIALALIAVLIAVMAMLP